MISSFNLPLIQLNQPWLSVEKSSLNPSQLATTAEGTISRRSKRTPRRSSPKRLALTGIGQRDFIKSSSSSYVSPIVHLSTDTWYIYIHIYTYMYTWTYIHVIVFKSYFISSTFYPQDIINYGPWVAGTSAPHGRAHEVGTPETKNMGRCKNPLRMGISVAFVTSM